jgi:tetratricopeptide (TPR) repeat protein
MNKSKLITVIALLVIIFNGCKPKTEVTEEPAAVTTNDTSAIGKKITEISNLMAANPDNADLVYKRAKLFIEQQNFRDASLDIVRAINMDSTKADYYIILSDVHLAANKPTLAKQSLEKCLTLQQDHKEGNMKLAELYFIARQYDKVFEHLNNILRKEINNPKAYMMKGMAYKELGDTAKAISSFQTAIEQDPKYYAPFMQLGVLYGEKGNVLAEQYFTGAINVNPRSEEALYGRAMYFQEVKHDYDKAIQDYTTIIQLNPKNKNAHFNLGYIHYEYLKVRDQAIKHYTDAITADPYYAEAYYNRGLTYEALGNIGAAKKDYEEAMRVRPDYRLAKAGLERVGQ